jgi:flagellar biosynthetic protein FlhB
LPQTSLQDKTEPATAKKREDARKKGQVAKSREITSAAILLAGLLFLFFGAKGMTQDLAGMIKGAFHSIPSLNTSDFNVVVLVHKATEIYLLLVLPMMLVLFCVAVLGNYFQIGFVWSVESLAPKASKINPMQGAKRMFSKRSLVELGKSIAKILILGWAAYSTLKGELGNIIQLSYQGKGEIISYLGGISFDLVKKSCYIIVILAILDYFFQKWQYEEKLKMTKQEVKEEFRQMEGDPLVRSRIRSIQREVARRRMMEDVKTADVVITNPFHLSIAVRYDSITMKAPKIVAKGADQVALRIREKAEEFDIPLVENKLLARNLYKTVDIGQEIPAEFYKAVAEILAYVYGLKSKTV